MFIQTEHTPNPATLKFLPGSEVMPSGTRHFETPTSAQASPLAQALFNIEGVSAVFFGKDFISVTKAEGTEAWSSLKVPVLAAIMEHFSSQAPLLLDEPKSEPTTAFTDAPEDTDIILQIKDLIDTRIRPAVARDGGDIVYQGFQNGIVYLKMQGSCAGCPSSTATLKGGIESLLRHYVPEVSSVQAV